MAAKEIVYIRGKLHWAKVLGEPVPNYEKTGNEWAFDLALDDDGVRQMKGIKVNGKPVKDIKNRDDDRGDFISFRQKELRADGKPNKRIAVMDATGKEWDQDEKLGNGTIADVKFEVVDYGKGRYAGVYPRAIRILDHVPYQSQEFAPLSEEDEFFQKPSKSESTFTSRTAPDDIDDLDDDVL